MKMKKTAIASLLLSSIFVIGLAGCDSKPKSAALGGSEMWANKYEWMTVGEILPTQELQLPASQPAFGSASVHDPSVYFDEVMGDYYAFGSHFAVGKSKDLIKWEQAVSEGGSSKLYGSTPWKQVLSQSVETAHTDNSINSTWAPDVLQIGNTYYMYYSLTEKFGSGRSVIGRVSSSEILGPYSNEEVIVYSQGNGGEPNCIDPELFYDKEGRLWMVFGSFYGGIFIKELHATGDKAGLPIEEDPTNHGKLLWKRGASAGVEGPFVFYNAELDYYYLMVSEGDLNTNYNMRVARSKNPDGPYEDIAERDVVNGGGNKIAGNYQFMDENSGYAAMGHNSVIKKDGKYLVVYHSRFGSGDTVSGNHSLYVNQLYFNEDGWPVLSPNRYVGEEKGTVTESKVAGDYEIVVHKTETVKTYAQSVRYTLSSDGKVKDAEGAEVGGWSLKDGYYVTLTLNETEYKGVVCTGWRNTKGGSGGVISITATSATGGPLWAQAVLS